MRHIFLAFTNPVPGQEAAFNAWYDTYHVLEVLRYGRGFTGCKRFKLQAELRSGAIAPWQYLALYDVLTADLVEFAEKPWRAGAPRLTPFRGLLEDDHAGWVFTPRASADREHSRGIHAAADSLLIDWSIAVRDEAAEVSLAPESHLYDLAYPQRGGQPESPWRGLVIHECRAQGPNPTLLGGDAAWRFEAVSPYVSRSDP